MAVTVVAVGAKHESWVKEGLERYQKRLRKPYDVKWVLLPHSQYEGDRARQEESERIASKLPERSYVVLLDEVGKNIDSPALSDMLDREFNHGEVTVVIGGAYGVTQALRERADFVWSLSKLVFPHQLVRLLLVEQIYRAQEIAAGGKYHHV